MDVENEYINIRNTVNRIFCTAEDLDRLKCHFRSAIDSERSLDRINGLSRLIRILEKRDSLNSKNIEPFQTIARFFNRQDLLDWFNNYGALRVSAEIPTQPMPLHRFQQNPNEPPVLPSLQRDPVERVIVLICSEIGQKWKDFARSLEVREGPIDELEAKYATISERAREILRFHRQNAGEQMWKMLLYDGLDRARRKDLRIEFDVK
ncbi:hypothetical protein JTB14_002693 [Gonioctena quinquepunctata]|nr:hypothetical protein JTB14_002693 [Gonioctena quinquepunctata]